MVEEIGRQRLAGMSVMAREAAATGQLAVTEEECRDLIWATTDGMLWQRLVRERGWTDEEFAGWLGETWVRGLVLPGGGHAQAGPGLRRRGDPRCLTPAQRQSS